jgi:8-oxo-dGTP diphosphatase
VYGPRREVTEETGLEIAGLRRGPYTNDVFEREGRHYITLFVMARLAGGALENREPDKCGGWEWFEWEHLPEPLFLPIQNLMKQGFSLSSTAAPI